MHLSMWIFPWDLMDEGVETVLKRIHDELGIDTVSVALSYDAGKMLLPHNPRRKVYFAEEGVVYFQPMPAWYAGLDLQPTVSSICKERNLLAEVIDASNKLGMRVVGWLLCCHNTRLASQRRDCAAVNCFGDTYITHLCPSNDSVRELISAIVGDLVTNYPLYAVELEAFEYMPFQHAYHHVKMEIELPPLVDFLLGLCFCHACERRARESGVDFEAVRNSVRSELESFFSSPSSYPCEKLNWDMITTRFGTEMEGYLQMRITSMDSLLKFLHERVGLRGRTKLHLFGEAHPTELWQIGLEPSLLMEHADGVIVLAYRLSPDQLRISLRVNRVMLKEKTLIVGLLPSEKYVGSFDGFVERIRICIENDVDGLSFFNYGVLSRHHLKWINSALEYAVTGK
ncbi:MAG: hypothetical protein RMK18_04810 [Armatimonadota bacterium]|nr:family 10 glycosylhydrolase [Armatimonadota bacterium]MCX7777125.1 family 10 glycosylhydrolase [Armatimonadota bacterium]MDW8025172.1 hypothetical protein [Armatimonadota bacterium]